MARNCIRPQFYGFRPDPTNGNGLPPFIDDDYTDSDDIGPGNGLRRLAAICGRSAWVSVPVLFETPPGYLVGFRDYFNILAGAEIGTQGGPMLYVGNYGASAEGRHDDPHQFFRLADDIDEDGIAGSGFIVDPMATSSCSSPTSTICTRSTSSSTTCGPQHHADRRRRSHVDA